MNPDLQDDSKAGAEAWAPQESSTVSLIEALTWLGEAKKRLAFVAAAGAFVGLGLAFTLPVKFTATTTFLPPAATQSSGSAAVLSALGPLGGLASAGLKTPDEMYLALLTSDSVVRGLDSRFKLLERYGLPDQDALKRKMASVVRVMSDKKSGLISLEVDDRDPEFAARLANAHAEEVSKVLSRLAIGEAHQRRVFYEGQIKDAKEVLVQAEAGLRAVQERSGMIALEKQAESAVMGVAQLRAAIAEREVQMKVLRVDSTEHNPAVVKLSSELSALKSELARAESAQGPSAVGVSMAKLPAAAVEYVRARRELKIQETLMEGLIRQYEIAKLDEAKESPSLQQVDIAQVPQRKSAPRRGLLVLGCFMLGLLSAMAWILGKGYVHKVRRDDPDRARSWAAMACAWRWSRA